MIGGIQVYYIMVKYVNLLLMAIKVFPDESLRNYEPVDSQPPRYLFTYIETVESISGQLRYQQLAVVYYL